LIKPIIYLITEGKLTAENFEREAARVLEMIETAAAGKISLIQIREKKLPARLVFELTERAAKITRNSETKLLVNDRADIALAAGADGVHLTESSIAAAAVRRRFPEGFLIGVSTHSPEAAEKASAEGADFVTFSPVFASPGKPAPKGLPALRELCEKLRPFPVVALGGIEMENFREVLDAGASGFAAIRFLNNADDLRLIVSLAENASS
jgi:thiamine-phosphate pyrophosphorylase